MYPQSDLVPDAPVIGADELAEGLMLVRASTLKIIRLQLAIERHDRRVAIEAIDDLMALERRLEEQLANGPGFPGRQALEEELQSDGLALNREKLTLGAQVLRNGGTPALFQGPASASDTHPITPLPAPEPPREQLVEKQAEWIAQPYEVTSRRRRWVIGLMLVLAALAAAAYFLDAAEYLPHIEATFGGLT